MKPSERTADQQVLVVLDYHNLGGTQINAIDLASALRPDGYESTCVVFREDLPTARHLEDYASSREVELIVLDRSPATLGAGRQLRNLATERHVSIVHAYGAGAARAAYWGPCLFGRRPLIHTVYEMSVPDDVYKHTHLIVGAQYLVEEQARRPGPLTLISPPVDLQKDHPGLYDSVAAKAALQLDHTRVAIVIVSRLDSTMKEAPVRDAILAMELLGDERSELVVVGDGDARERLEAVANSVNERMGYFAVRLLGALTDPRRAYAAADVVIGMGGSAARALAFGKCLVVSGEHGWYQAFSHDTAMSLFRTSFWRADVVGDSVNALAGVLRPLVRDGACRAELGEYGRAFAETHFDLHAMASRLHGVYTSPVPSRTRAFRTWAADLKTELPRARGYLARLQLPGRATHRDAATSPSS